MNKVFLNNKLINENQAKISIFDHGLIYGDGIFETMRSFDAKVFMLGDHLERLKKSAAVLSLRIPWNKTYLSRAITKTLSANRLKNAYIRIAITRGPGPLGLDIKGCDNPTLIILATPLKKTGLKMINVCISKMRKDPNNPLNYIKSSNYLQNIIAKVDAKKRGFDDAIFLNTNGFITETTTSNIFIVNNSGIVTPEVSCGLLEGITRSFIIYLARSIKIPVGQGKLTYKDIARANEIFLTNSISAIIPVASVNSKRVGEGKIGKITKLLNENYYSATQTRFLPKCFAL